MRFLILSLILSTFFVACQEPAPRPNIILIMCDDLGWGDVGFNGNRQIKTPHLDQLAAKGMRFSRFYAASAVCSPTRASCLTGRNPNRMGIPTANAGHMKASENTLPELLSEAGYLNGHFGKWHLGTLTSKIKDANRGRPQDSSHYALPSAHGYDTYFCTESKVPTWDPLFKPAVFDTSKEESLRYGWAAREAGEKLVNYGTYYWHGPEEMALNGLEGDNSKVILDRVIPFVQEAVSADRPFFTTVWLHTPHLPVSTSAYYREMYPERSFKEQLYYGSISAMDEQVGRLWQELERLGIADNTMLWFCSDNGPERGTPGSAGIYRERKRSLYEGGVRVPAFCVWPSQIQAEQQTDFPAFTSDYLPTILDYLQLSLPDERPMDGLSLRKPLDEAAEERGEPMGFLFHKKQSWLSDRYKLISLDAGKTYELYDLASDPAEQADIAAEHPKIVASMQTELDAWLSSMVNSEAGNDY